MAVKSRPDVLGDLSDIDAANVARCAKVLLRHPLLRPGGPDGDLLPLVYRYRISLQEMFASLLGYRLVVERRFARLYKSGPGEDSTRGEPALSPRGYAYVCLTMAALTGVGRQVLLSRLVADVRAAASEAGLDVVDDVGDRRALTAALRHLIALGVITETDGTVAGLISETPPEALITIHTDLLGQLLAGPLAEAESADELVELASAPGRLGVEHAVRRRLVEDPVTLHADLPPEQAEWLLRNQRRESVVLERCFGLVTEIRAEGVAVTDPEEYLTDVVFPSTGTVARITLLALPELVDQSDVSDDEPEYRPDGRIPVSQERLLKVCRNLVEDYPAAWSRQATDDVAALADDVTDLLVRLTLAVPDGDGWLISPAAHRWLPQPDDSPGRPVAVSEIPPEPGWSLFDDEGAR
ncbi:TIGR02678 family protein [Actinokineospora diospyrosa]|uniref:TIGR02678 family protein n=1 Tax=Actinokineospora diospyrosa TaxID=103728 RepID=A0ABT1ILQ6_9PSEU|nr:TIGR02678 family protein [Actinokineospora diospyrosa]MCP2273441.1 TIGR02678 family protein [Actinokineospora diospyrosa]